MRFAPCAEWLFSALENPCDPHGRHSTRDWRCKFHGVIHVWGRCAFSAVCQPRHSWLVKLGIIKKKNRRQLMNSAFVGNTGYLSHEIVCAFLSVLTFDEPRCQLCHLWLNAPVHVEFLMYEMDFSTSSTDNSKIIILDHGKIGELHVDWTLWTILICWLRVRGRQEKLVSSLRRSFRSSQLVTSLLLPPIDTIKIEIENFPFSPWASPSSPFLDHVEKFGSLETTDTLNISSSPQRATPTSLFWTMWGNWRIMR